MHIPEKSAIQQLWQSSSPAWEQWAENLQAMADKFNQPLLNAVDIQAGDWVLDLASGAGEPALSVAQRVGESGLVIASDLVPSMLQGVKRRAAGISHLHALAADMENLPFATESLDKITCRFGIMFAPNWAQAVAECQRILKPQGKVAFMLWGALPENTVFHVIRQAAEQVFPDNTAYAHEFLPFLFADPAPLLATMQQQGLHCHLQTLEFSPKVPDSVKFWQAPLEMSFAARYQAASSEQRQAWEMAILQALEAYRQESFYQLKVRLHILVGEKLSEPQFAQLP
ncbi:MAG: methyltransferase domain-containing protein [Thiotrichaceae bacterium]|nr:methyltransferase domain-containing protein [Thiotrichaceae bacterium]